LVHEEKKQGGQIMSNEENIQYLEQQFDKYMDMGCSAKDSMVMAYEDLIFGELTTPSKEDNDE